MPRRIIQALDELSRSLGVRVLTPEYEILLALLDRESMTSDELSQSCSASRARFFYILDRLKNWGYLSFQSCRTDRRRKLYQLDPKTKHALHQHFKALQGASVDLDTFSLRQQDGAFAEEQSDSTPTAKYPPRLPHLTDEYEVLLYLFLKPGTSRAELVETISASRTKIHGVLRMLKTSGLIETQNCPDDARKVLHFPSQTTRSAIALSIGRVFEYLDALKAVPAAAECPRHQIAP
jgi:DNA-binding MarR family transcriptional regulator